MTKLQNLINPQVLADFIEQKLVYAMKFTPLCRVDNTLSGRAGDTVTLPSFTYIGDAVDVAELANIPISTLTASTQEVKIKKVGRGAGISDEAVLSGYGDPIGELGQQLTLAIASKLDNDVLAALGNATYVHPVTAVNADEVNNALVHLGEDFEGEKYLFVSPASYAALRNSADWLPASEISAGIMQRGVVGMVHGCYVVPTNKIAATNLAYIVKPGAVALFMKRGTQVENDRNIVNKSTTFTADKHYAAYLYDYSKVVRMGAALLTALGVTQTSNIVGGLASFAVAGYPTNLSFGWKAYFAPNLVAAVNVSVGDTYATHAAAFGSEFVEGQRHTSAAGRFFQVIYVDANGKVRGSGTATIATTI